MDYFSDAFGNFDPEQDQNAAVKFVLNCILVDDRLSELLGLLSNCPDIGGIAGEPGWIIQRRGKVVSSIGNYSTWPTDADFCVNVDQDAFYLAFPELFLNADEFYDYVRKGIAVYSVNNPSKDFIVRQVLSQVRHK